MKKLPRGWVNSSIGSLCTLNNGRAFKPSEWSESGLPIVRIQNLNKADAPFNYFDGKFESKYHLKGGELLFAWSGTPGTSFGAHIWRGGEAVLNQHIFRVDFNESLLDKRFFRHAINQTLGELIDIAHGGVGLRHVTKGKFENTEITLPPYSEQKRIADKLDAVLARLDACRERLERVPLILKRFRQSVLAAAISGQLTADWRKKRIANPIATEAGDQQGGSVSMRTIKIEGGEISVPAFWRDFTLRDLISPSRPLCYGVVQPGEASEGGVPLIRVQDMEKGTVNIQKLRTVSTEVDQEYKRSRVKAGDLLISIVGTIGRTAIVPNGFEGNIARAVARITPNSETTAGWLNIWLASDVVQWSLLCNSREVARKTLNLSELAQTRVALPNFDEQNEIVRRVETLFAFADRLNVRLADACSVFDRLMPALLAKAFRGELVPQDPDDEPAAELLKRIAAQKVSSKPARKRKAVEAESETA